MKLDFKVFGLGALLGVLVAVAPACGGGQTGCNSTNCANGCCSAAGACLTGTANSACGASGAACMACSTGNVCTAGACVPSSTGGGTGGGAMGGGTGGGAMGGGTGGGDMDAGTGGGGGDMDAGTGGGGGDMDAGTGGGGGDMDAGTGGGGGDMDAGTGGGGGDMDAGTGGGGGDMDAGTGGGGGDMDAGMDAGVDVNAQIAAVRTAADTTPGTVSLPINGALVTYLKPLVPSAGTSDPAGFFLQGDPMGPALFVAIDPSTLAGGLAVGDLLDLTVDTVAKSGGLRQATAVSGVTISSHGNPVSGFAQSVSNVDFTDSANLDTYESRLISMTGTVTSEPAAAGGGYKSASVDTMGTMDGGTTIKLRLPVAVMDAEYFGPACTFTMTGTPMWRFNTQAQPSAFASNELSAITCPGPALVSASASSPTQVTANFSRDLDGMTVDAGVFSITGGSGLTVSDAVLASPRSVTLTTSSQTDMQAYALTATSDLADMRGTAFTGNSVNFTGVGTAQCMPGVVISAVFGGNSSTGAFNQDFVELHNRTSTSVDVTGWSVQYASATGSSWSAASLTGSIAAGGYFLVGLASSTGGTAIPTPDSTGGLNLSGTNGKVALVNSATALSGVCPTGMVDLVGYGSATCFEGAAAVGVLSSANSAVRNDATGATAACIDTNNNGGDFTVGPAATPRNSASPANSCTCP